MGRRENIVVALSLGSSWRNADHYLDLRRRIISGELFDTVLVPAR
jgi:hypothetical protein